MPSPPIAGARTVTAPTWLASRVMILRWRRSHIATVRSAPPAVKRAPSASVMASARPRPAEIRAMLSRRRRRSHRRTTPSDELHAALNKPWPAAAPRSHEMQRMAPQLASSLRTHRRPAVTSQARAPPSIEPLSTRPAHAAAPHASAPPGAAAIATTGFECARTAWSGTSGAPLCGCSGRLGCPLDRSTPAGCPERASIGAVFQSFSMRSAPPLSRCVDPIHCSAPTHTPEGATCTAPACCAGSAPIAPSRPRSVSATSPIGQTRTTPSSQPVASAAWLSARQRSGRWCLQLTSPDVLEPSPSLQRTATPESSPEASIAPPLAWRTAWRATHRESGA
eukprot:scaffold149779_cov36-Tisochrysis_lutea.AAC.2